MTRPSAVNVSMGLGFNWGDAANFSWQLEGPVGLRLTHWLAAFVGYRALYYDLDEGESALRNGTELTEHGPIMGAGVSF